MFLREWNVKKELKNLFSNQSKEIEMFDAGCGFGQYSYFCLKSFSNFKIYAIDIETHHIERAKSFFSNSAHSKKISFAIEDLTQINHQSKFDFILSVDVMEHIKEDEKVFQNFYRALKPNGVLLVNTPSIYGGSDTESDTEESFISEHARNGYSTEEISNKLTSAGFIIEKIKFTYGKIGIISWRLGIKLPMLMLNQSKLFLIILPFYYLLTFWLTLILMFIDFKTQNQIGAGLIVVARKN